MNRLAQISGGAGRRQQAHPAHAAVVREISGTGGQSKRVLNALETPTPHLLSIRLSSERAISPFLEDPISGASYRTPIVQSIRETAFG